MNFWSHLWRLAMLLLPFLTLFRHDAGSAPALTATPEGRAGSGGVLSKPGLDTDNLPASCFGQTEEEAWLTVSS